MSVKLKLSVVFVIGFLMGGLTVLANHSENNVDSLEDFCKWSDSNFQYQDSNFEKGTIVIKCTPINDKNTSTLSKSYRLGNVYIDYGYNKTIEYSEVVEE